MNFEMNTDLFYKYINHYFISDIMITDFGYENCDPKKPTILFNNIKNVILHFVLDGKGTLNINKKTYQCKKGEMFFISHESFYSYCQDKNDPWKYFWISLYGEKALQLCNTMNLSIYSPVYKIEEPENLFQKLYCLYKNCEEHKNSLDIFALSSFLDIASTIINEQNSHTDGKKNTSKEQYISFITNYIKSNLTNDSLLKIDKIAQQLHLSPNYLSHLFTDYTGTPIHNYIISLKLQRACTYLETTDMPIKEVAMYSGFSNPLYFSRLFYKYKKQTPSQYRAAFMLNL